MEFKNLDNRILLWLTKKRKENGNNGPYRTAILYKFYSDLPDEYITKELKNITWRDSLRLIPAKTGCTSRIKAYRTFNPLPPMIGGILWGSKSWVKCWIDSGLRVINNQSASSSKHRLLVHLLRQLKEQPYRFFHLPIWKFSFYQLVVFSDDFAVVLNYSLLYFLFHVVLQKSNRQMQPA